MRGRSCAIGLVLAFVSAAASGCYLWEDHCPDLRYIDMQGSRADFTTPAGEHDGVYLHEPVLCEGGRYREGHLIALEGLGESLWNIRSNVLGGCPSEDDSDCWVESAFLESTALVEMEAAGIWAERVRDEYGCFLQVEADELSRIYMFDWRQADAAVSILMRHMRQLDLGEWVVLAVGPDRPYCM
ncbi:MAG: hypothetical protein JXR96_10255 [Deltaproteobacteria bacterium]|nr:hypothetical protein [Deltaproteobacteria bacterium]